LQLLVLGVEGGRVPREHQELGLLPHFLAPGDVAAQEAAALRPAVQLGAEALAVQLEAPRPLAGAPNALHLVPVRRQYLGGRRRTLSQ
jgi:hypothetical protein